MFSAARFILVAWVGLALTVQAAPAALDRCKRVQIGGLQYVRLRDWAGANRFDFAWVQPNKTLQLTGAGLKIVLTADSKLMLVSGVSLWLCHPVVVPADHNAYLSALDLKTALTPLVAPPRHPAPIRLVALDPGHGGRDRGFYKGARFEKNYTLLLAQEVRDQLAKAGVKAMLTRTKDEYVERAARPELARTRKADLFVSLHFNAANEGSKEAKGAEVYCMTPVGARSTNTEGANGNTGPEPGNIANDRNVVLAYLLQRALVKTVRLDDRSVRRARFEVLREATMPAALIEGGFLSHAEEGNRIADPAFRRKLARAIADGILAYKRTVEPKVDTPKP